MRAGLLRDSDFFFTVAIQGSRRPEKCYAVCPGKNYILSASARLVAPRQWDEICARCANLKPELDHLSENEFESELQLARIDGSACNLAVVWAADGCVRWSEDRVIWKIECL